MGSNEGKFLVHPGVMALGAMLLAWSMYWLDVQIPNEVLNTSRFIISGSVGELRGFLFAMATAVLTTAGVVFTLLTLPLSTVLPSTAHACCVSFWVIARPSSFWVCLWLHLPIVSLVQWVFLRLKYNPKGLRLLLPLECTF